MNIYLTKRGGLFYRQNGICNNKYFSSEKMKTFEMIK